MDRARFEKAVEQMTDDETIALRTAYWEALVYAATNLNPKLSDYGVARLAVAKRSGKIGGGWRG